jgi:hypothetical protein
MAQAHETRDRLIAAHGWASEAITIVPVTASGDKVAGSLADAGGKALWTKELDQWLHDGEIDFAVHCLKDMETIRPAFLTIAAILPREDVRDCLITGPGVEGTSIETLPHGARLGTSAPRRASQALHLRPDLTIVPIRGNVATRLGKLAAGMRMPRCWPWQGSTGWTGMSARPCRRRHGCPPQDRPPSPLKHAATIKLFRRCWLPWTMRPPAMPCWARGPCWRLWAAHATARSPF